MQKTKPFGLVLAGGQSKRMGSDKGLLNYNGKPQREHIFELLATFCEKVFTSCRKGQEIPAFLNPLVDSYDIPGPMNGILSAFQTHPTVGWLIVAVDMPFIDANALQILLQNRNPEKAATCFLHSPIKFPEPLFTLWEPSAFPALLNFVHSGQMSPRMFLEQADIHAIEPPEEKFLLNINYPTDGGPLL